MGCSSQLSLPGAKQREPENFPTQESVKDRLWEEVNSQAFSKFFFNQAVIFPVSVTIKAKVLMIEPGRSHILWSRLLF